MVIKDLIYVTFCYILYGQDILSINLPHGTNFSGHVDLSLDYLEVSLNQPVFDDISCNPKVTFPPFSVFI